MKMDRQIAAQRLQKCLDLSDSVSFSDLLNYTYPWIRHGEPEEVKTWKRATKTVIAETFGDNSPHVQDFDSLFTRDHLDILNSPLQKAKKLLAAMIEEVRVYWDEETGTEALRELPPSPLHPYVDHARIKELATIHSDQFDLSELITFCEELNVCWEKKCYHAVIFLTRKILDYVPPVFGYKNFSGVANNYDGGKSFKQLMLRLDTASRKIADSHLHRQIRQIEPPINRVQVNFSNELDMLLQEIILVFTTNPHQSGQV